MGYIVRRSGSRVKSPYYGPVISTFHEVKV